MAGLLTKRQINRRFALALVAFGSGLLLGRGIPPILWSLALVGFGVYLLWGRGRRDVVAPLLVFFLGTFFIAPARFFSVPQVRGELTRVYTSTPEEAQDWAGLETLKVRNSAGNIDVVGGQDLSLEATYVYGKKATIPGSLLVTYADNTLSFTGVEPSLTLEQRRGVRARLHASVPRGVALEVSGRMGDVSAAGLGSVRIDTNIGDISVREVTGALLASSDVGNVAVSGARGGIEVHTQVGHIFIDLASVGGYGNTVGSTRNAPVLAQTDVGDITLVVPADADAHIIASSTSGALPAELTRRKPTEGELTLGRGTQTIVLKTRIGAVRVLRQ